jgi:hypothetical protein
MVQKQSINNSDCAKHTIAICILCGAKATVTNMALTLTYVNNKPFMRWCTNFYIVSNHLTTTNMASTTTYVNNKPLMRWHTNFCIVSDHLANINHP